jgi:hypothetical protein
MPVTRFGGSEDERLSGIAKAQPSYLNALKTNRAIGDAIISDINKHYGENDLGDRLGGANAIHVSFSWG